VLACDISKTAKEVYIANFGDAYEWVDDLYSIKALPRCDVLCAGFPCQPFSTAGNRQGLDDDAGRGRIITRILHLVQKAAPKPRLVLLENVPGILTIANGGVVRYIVRVLTGMGYSVNVVSVDAKQFGSPVARKRVFFAAVLGGKLTGEPLATTGKRKTIRDCLDAKVVGDVAWKPPSTYELFEEDKWVRYADGKIAVGHKKGNPHGQARTIWHADGAMETFTRRHTYLIYVPGAGVRALTPREMFTCMGFPRTFRLHPSLTVSNEHICNSINLFALRAVLKWAWGERSSPHTPLARGVPPSRRIT
jgi:DNA (cytosine-5)-methyltransferase 1